MGASSTAAKDLRVIARTTQYPPEAFLFVQRGLDHTVRQIHGDLDDAAARSPHKQESRHVDGSDLCCGLRDYAVEQYGLLARAVLRRWRIDECEDFGRIVFAMVDAGLMYKTDDDTLEDFRAIYDFEEAFASDLDLEASQAAMDI